MRGLLMPIGGAEDKGTTCRILDTFVEICGKTSAHIVIIPSASSIPIDVAHFYQSIFYRLGVAQVSIIHVSDRQQANLETVLHPLQNATGVFITGGDQLRLISLIGGTRLGEILYQRSLTGMPIAGTSAGASIMSRHMIAFGRSGPQPSQRMVQMASGLGLTHSLIIDQHFSQRNRLGRLLTAVALNPGLTGVGIDENTALIIRPDDTLEVIGAGTVTVADSQGLTYNGIYAAKRHDAFQVQGIDIRVLREDDRLLSLKAV